MKTELTSDELRRALAPFDLQPKNAKPFEKGTVNSNYRVVTDGGVVFLRVNEGKREADVRYEAGLLWHLGTRRFPTPQPLRTSAGEGYTTLSRPDGPRYVTVFPWIPGREIEPPSLSPAQATRLGEMLARFHIAARDFPHRREGIYTFEHLVQRVESFRARSAEVPLLAHAMPVLDDEVVFLRSRRAAELPSGTIHGDLFPDNVLWDSPRLVVARPRPSSKAVRPQAAKPADSRDVGEGISAVLDFEQASWGRYAYDLAVTMLAWCFREEVRSPGLATEGGGLIEALGWALLSGYQRVRPLTDEEREALWVEARLAAFRFTVTRVTDVFLPSLPPQSVAPRPGKDFRDYLARLLHLRATGPDPIARMSGERPPLRSV